MAKISSRDQPAACLTLAPELKDTVPAETDGLWFSLYGCDNLDVDDRQLFDHDFTTKQLILMSTGSCVTLEDPVPNIGTRIMQYSCYGRSTQRWQYDSSTRSLRPLANTKLCLAVKYNGQAPALTNLGVFLTTCTVNSTDPSKSLGQQWSGTWAGIQSTCHMHNPA